MNSKGFILLFTKTADAMRMTADELKRRGYEVEIVDRDTQGVALVCRPSGSSTAMDAEPLVEIEINESNDIAQILSKLADLALIGRLPAKDDVYDEEDEAIIRNRLESLGYL
jgi:hypothetical protein